MTTTATDPSGPVEVASEVGDAVGGSPDLLGRVGVPGLALGAILAGWTLSIWFGGGGVRLEALGFALVWIGSLTLLALQHRAGWQAPAGIYLLVFGLFHGGLLFSVALRGASGMVVPAAATWIHAPGVPTAVRLSMLGCTAFTAAVLLVGRHGGASEPEPPPGPERSAAPAPDDPEHRSFRIGLVGLGTLVLGLSSTSVAVLVSGSLSQGYDAVFSSASGSALFAYGMLFVGVGLIFSLTGTPAQRRLGLLAFGLFGLVAIPIGMRGPVLFVVAAAFAVEVRRGFRVRLAVAVAAGLAVLMVIGVVRETRSEGPAAIARGDWLGGPLDAVGEMGFSLYPTVVVAQWHDEGQPYRRGVTLVAVPLRFAESLLGTPPPIDDDRLFDVEINSRVGGIGGSPVAEGFHNFGPLGVAALLGAIGAVIAAFDRRRSTAANDALLGLVLLPLLVDVRNFFAAVPAQMTVSLALLGLALLIPRRSLAQRAVHARQARPAPSSAQRAVVRPPVGPRTEGPAPTRHVRHEASARAPLAPRPTRNLIATMAGANLVQAAVTAAGGLWATIVLGVEARGVMVIAITTAATVSLLGGLGTGAALRNRLPTANAEQRDRLARAYGSLSVAGAFACAGLSLAIMAICSATIDARLGGWLLQLVVCASAFAQTLRTQMLDAWYADGEFNRGSLLAAAAAGLGLVGLVVGGLISRSPTAMIVGGLAGEAAVTAWALVLLRRRGLMHFGGGRRADARDLVRQGWPTMGVGVGIIIVFRADRYVLGAFSGAAAVTVYSLAATLAEVTRTVPHQIGQLFIHQIASGDRRVSLVHTVRSAMVAMLGTALVVAVVGWFAIPPVFGEDLRDARQYLLLLLGAEVLFCPFFVASRGLMGGGWTRATGVIGAVGCVAAVALYLVLVPQLGTVGACLASAIVYLGLSVATVVALDVRLRTRAADAPVDQTAPDDPSLDPSLTA